MLLHIHDDLRVWRWRCLLRHGDSNLWVICDSFFIGQGSTILSFNYVSFNYVRRVRRLIAIQSNYRGVHNVDAGLQQGRCNGCKVKFPFRNMTVDHVRPQSRGGTDHLENLHLLCNYCNSLKGSRFQEYLLAELAKLRTG